MASRALPAKVCNPLLPSLLHRALCTQALSLRASHSPSLQSLIPLVNDAASPLAKRPLPLPPTNASRPVPHFAPAPLSNGLALTSAPALATAQVLGIVCHVAVPDRSNPSLRKQQIELPFSVRALHSSSEAAATAETVNGSTVAVEVEMGQSKGVAQERGRGRGPGKYWRISRKKVFREDGTEWPWHSFTPADSYSANTQVDLDKHFTPANFGDTFAKYLVKSLRIPADLFFQRRYGCRAMMLETVAAVPGMVAGALLHLKSLRLIEHSGGWIKALLEEAENERMHLMTFMEVSQPKWYERALIFGVQGVFCAFYGTAYVLSPRVAHRIVGFLEEEAVHSYTEFLRDIDAGIIDNVAAPQIAIDYWQLPKGATLRDVVEVVRADEAHHRDVNHFAASIIQKGDHLKDNPAPLGYH